MPGIKAGQRVAIHYIGTLDNGRIFGSTQDDEPLVFTMGAGEVFPALERVVAGMRVGEARNITIPSAEAYGPRMPENVLRLRRSDLPTGRELRIGQKLSVEFGGGAARVMVVAEVSEDAVTLDGNHPLSGLDLTFAIRLDAIDEP